MLPIVMDDVAKFVELQSLLMSEFSKQYPASKDFKWLLDFPKGGTIKVANELWKFVKHGAGLQFIRVHGGHRLIIDIHKCVDQPNIIDEWRLLEFFESYRDDVGKEKLSLLLGEMCSNGYLLSQGEGLYLWENLGKTKI